MSRSVVRRVLSAVALSWLFSFRCGAAETLVPDFFAVSLHKEAKDIYLEGEDVRVELEVHNKTNTGLRYMSTLHPKGGFICGMQLKLLRENREVPNVLSDVTLWGTAVWSPSMIRTLDQGKKISRTVSLRNLYGTLEAGNYRVIADLSQQNRAADRLGLATGTASAEIAFVVKAWKSKRCLERTFQRTVGQTHRVTTVSIVETTEGQRLVCWRTRYADEAQSDLHAIPITLHVSLAAIRWEATERACYIAHQAADTQSVRLIVVDNDTSSVTYLTLR